MTNKVTLGGINVKLAGSYLIRPQPLPKKPKKKTLFKEDTAEKQAAAIIDAVINEQQLAMQARLSSITQQ